MKRTFFALVAAVAMLGITTAPADAVVRRTSLVDIQDEVMCPVCGVPLSIAGDAPLARRERVFIVALIDRGKTKSEIKRALVDQFGDGVLATPRNRGFGRTAYLAPGLAVIAGLAVAMFAALRWRRQLPPAAAAPTASRDAEKRLNADLDRYDL